MLSIPLGIITANFVEWTFHKYVLHGLGKNKNSIFSAHWHDHHRIVRKKNMVDSFYFEPASKQIKAYEVKTLIVGGLMFLPIFKKFPLFIGTILSYGVAYYFIHRRSHLDSKWASKWLPWHVRHHLGKNQDKNWGVVLPFSDIILGTYTK